MDLSPGKESEPRIPFAGLINLVVVDVVVTNRQVTHRQVTNWQTLAVLLLYQFRIFRSSGQSCLWEKNI